MYCDVEPVCLVWPREAHGDRDGLVYNISIGAVFQETSAAHDEWPIDNHAVRLDGGSEVIKSMHRDGFCTVVIAC